MSELEQLQQLIQSKKDSNPSLSYTAKLFSQGIEEGCSRIITCLYDNLIVQVRVASSSRLFRVIG